MKPQQLLKSLKLLQLLKLSIGMGSFQKFQSFHCFHYLYIFIPPKFRLVSLTKDFGIVQTQDKKLQNKSIKPLIGCGRKSANFKEWNTQ